LLSSQHQKEIFFSIKNIEKRKKGMIILVKNKQAKLIFLGKFLTEKQLLLK